MSTGFDTILHASCVVLHGRGLLILGASGSGKSSLALDLMSRGAGLVADDRTGLRAAAGRVLADCPDAIRGRIEARGVGILNARAEGSATLALVVDLDRSEPDRLPLRHRITLLGCELPLVLGQGNLCLAPALMQYLVAGRWDRGQT